jgi:AraC-like DNA-binding protein
MKLYIKNMVCNRCKMVVRSQLETMGFHPVDIELGEVELAEDPTKQQLQAIDAELKNLGFALIDDKKSKTIEKIKNAIVTLIHHSDDELKTNLSDFISAEVRQDYTYLSNLFSSIEGITIEKYYINQRIEKVKELLVYDELTLSEIAYRLGYSSVAYLSNQFKKVTGFTPSYFKTLTAGRRKNIDNL